MAVANPATATANLKSKFLEGLSPLDINVILAAAKQRHFTPNSVVVNQGSPADHLFLLTKGRARFFFNTQEGQKVIFFCLTPGEFLGGGPLLSTLSLSLASRETLKN